MCEKGQRKKTYSYEFKIRVVNDLHKNKLAYKEAERKYLLPHNTPKRWERIYLEEGAEGLMVERRGRNSKGRPRKKPLPTEVENDLIAENQRLKERNQYLEMEIEYLKKLDALVRAEEQKNGKKPR